MEKEKDKIIKSVLVLKEKLKNNEKKLMLILDKIYEIKDCNN